MSLPPDAQQVALIERIGAGDVEAFGELFDLLSPYVVAALRRSVRDEELTAELTVAVFQELWVMAPLWDRHVGRPLLWALALARSQANELKEGLRRAGETVPTIERPDDAERQAARAPASQVGSVLGALGPEDVEVLEAAWFGHPAEPDTVRLPDDDRTAAALSRFARALGGS